MKERLKKIMQWIKKKWYFVIILAMLTITAISLSAKNSTSEEDKLPYNDFIQMVEKQNVEKVEINLNDSTFTFYDKDEKSYTTDNPKDETFKKSLLEKGIKVEEVKSKSVLTNAILNSLQSTLWIIIFLVMISRFMPNSGLKDIKNEQGKHPDVSFKDIAGNYEAKEEMKILVDFLKTQKSIPKWGQKIPKGVLLTGPPGTGKTLLAKTVAGEANVPFYSMSGSDFVEKYVGVGAQRVRELFKLAKKKTPCIIFIDEIDSVGSKRASDDNSEKDQTINALLKEMGGFDNNSGIIVIAATNRLELLDDALIRPGRFDKKIHINLPDKNERLEIINFYAKNKKFSDNVNFEQLAKLTRGLAGAGLESMMNEATIIASSLNRGYVTQEDIDDAYFKEITMGNKKKNFDRKEKETKIVAWHEAGHALCSKLLTDYEVPKVSITPSTSGFGGMTLVLPSTDQLRSKSDLYNDIKIKYAGRVAEQLLLGREDKVTTGASNDIETATATIKDMFSIYGMNENFGMINLKTIGADENILMSETSFLSKRLYSETSHLLGKNVNTLEAIANALIEKETLNEEELDEIIKINK